MASVTAINPGISDLLQVFSATTGSPLSSTALQAALQSASPRDVVQLSEQALQLQEATNIFGAAA